MSKTVFNLDLAKAQGHIMAKVINDVAYEMAKHDAKEVGNKQPTLTAIRAHIPRARVAVETVMLHMEKDRP